MHKREVRFDCVAIRYKSSEARENLVDKQKRRFVFIGGVATVAALAILLAVISPFTAVNPTADSYLGNGSTVDVDGALLAQDTTDGSFAVRSKSKGSEKASSIAETDSDFPGKSEQSAKRQQTLLKADEVSDSLVKSEPPKKMKMPEWDLIFSPGGTLKDELDDLGARSSNGVPDHVELYGGIRADFIQDNLSNGIATDMSALLGAVDISSEVLYNGEVSPEHDLGNSYFLVTRNTKGETQVFVGIERLFVSMDSFIEIEFNQDSIRLGSGTGWWQISGDRMDGDLLARINFVGGRISDVEFEVWQAGGYNLLKAANGSPGKGCIRDVSYVYCGGIPPISHPPENFQVWDANFNLLEPTYPNDFVQIGINIERLTGQDLPFSGVLLRTPQDIAINRFYRPGAGRHAQHSERLGRHQLNVPLINHSEDS